MACAARAGNPYSGQDIYEDALRQIAMNLAYVKSIGGFRVSNKAGTPIDEWTAAASPSTQAINGIFATPDDVLYVGIGTQSGDYTTQTAFTVRRFDVEGTLIGSTTIPFGAGAGQVSGVTDLCVDGEGDIHLYDSENGDVRVFTVAGSHVRTYAAGLLVAGSCIGYNPANDRVYLSNNSGTVWAYSTTGTQLFSRSVTITDNGSAAVSMRSVGFAVSGNVVWLDYLNGKVWIHDADLSALVTSFTGSSASSGNGAIIGNSRLTVDFANQVYFGTDQNKVVRCNLNGTFQAAFGGSGAGLGVFNLIGHINVMRNGQVLVGDVNEDTVTRFHQAIVFIDVHFCPLRKYAATNECSVGEFSRIVPYGFTADGVLAPTPGAMNVPLPPTILGSGRYQAPMHVLVLRDLRQCCDEMGHDQQLVHPGSLRSITRDWSTEDDLYYSAVGHDSELLEAVDGTKQYAWQRTLGLIAARRPSPCDFIELSLVTQYLRRAAQAMVGNA